MNKDKYFVLESLLHSATGEAWRWMLHNYTKQDLIEVIKTSSTITPRDVYYWMYKFNLPKEEIKCLQTNSQTQSQAYWKQ